MRCRRAILVGVLLWGGIVWGQEAGTQKLTVPLEAPSATLPAGLAVAADRPKLTLPSRNLPAAAKVVVPRIELPPLSEAERQSLQNKPSTEKRTRIGVVRELKFSSAEQGARAELGEGREVWMLEVVSTGAAATRLHITGFDLPKGAKLYLASLGGDGEVHEFTGKGPWGDGEFWTPIFPDEGMRLELEMPRASATKVRVIAIGHVAADGVGGQVIQGCHIDASCHPEWNGLANSVALIRFNDGQFLYQCSAVLLNNNSGDLSPLVLTAHHCVGTETLAKTVSAGWFHRTQSCNSSNLVGMQSGGYATLLATSSVSDVTLLELLSALPPSVVFAGWNAAPPSTNAGIASQHHPGGEPLKISFGTIYPDLAAAPSFHRVVFNAGMAEGGSSGGPLFNQEKQVIGQLYGGNANCVNQAGDVLFGKLSVSYPLLVGPSGRNYLQEGLPDDSFSPNHSREAAVSVGPGEYTDLVLKAGPGDWFKFAVQDRYKISIRLKLQLLGFAAVELYRNGETEPIATGRSRGSNETALDYVTHGTSQDLYFLRVSYPAPVRARYSFQLTVEPPTAPSWNGMGVDLYTKTDTSGHFLASAYHHGATLHFWAEYGTTETLAEFIRTETVTYAPGESTAINMRIPFSGLTPLGQYYFRPHVSNGVQTISGPIIPFKMFPTRFTLTPSVLEFGSLAVGHQSASQSLHIQNTGTLPLVVDPFPPKSWWIVLTQCSEIAAGQSCEVKVAFRPEHPGVHWGGYYFASNASVLTSGVEMSGTGIAPDVDLNPAPNESYMFSKTWLGKSLQKKYLLLNTGNASLTFYQATTTGPYEVIGHSCTALLSPLASCPIDIVFSPAAVGSNQGSVTIHSNAKQKTFALIGEGIDLQLSLLRPARPGRHGAISNPQQFVISVGLSGSSPAEVELRCSASLGAACTVNPDRILLGARRESVVVEASASTRSQRLRSRSVQAVMVKVHATVQGITKTIDVPVQLQR